MNFDVITMFPGMFAGPLDDGMLARARRSGTVGPCPPFGASGDTLCVSCSAPVRFCRSASIFRDMDLKVCARVSGAPNSITIAFVKSGMEKLATKATATVIRNIL